MVLVRSVRICTFTDLGSVAVNCGSSSLMRSTTEMMLAPGCRWMFTITAGRLVHPGGLADVFGIVDHVGDVGQLDRRAVAVGDDQRR